MQSTTKMEVQMTNKKNKKFDTVVMENVLRHLKKTFCQGENSTNNLQMIDFALSPLQQREEK